MTPGPKPGSRLRPFLRDLVRLDTEVSVERYRQGQEALGQEPTELSAFHVDAAGYSPEVAAERGDPLYLCAGPLRAHALLVAEGQLTSRVVHPGMGLATAGYSKLLARFRSELSQLTLREAVVAEIHPRSGRPTRPEDLAEVEHFEIEFRSPSGLLRDRGRLEERKREFLASDRMWLDEAAIQEMIALASRVRDVAPLPQGLLSSSHSVDFFFTPAFSETYVLREKGARQVTTYILTGEAERSNSSHRVRTSSLDPREVIAALEGLGIASSDLRRHEREPEHLDRALYWIALDHLASRAELPESLDSRSVEVALRRADPPAEFLELSEVARKIRGRDALKLDELRPETALRVLLPSSTRGPVRSLVRHLLAGSDPLRLDLQWLDAPDLFFARLPRLDSGRLELLGRWIASERRET